MIERTKGRACTEVTSTGISPIRPRPRSGRARPARNSLRRDGLHGEVAVLALAHDRLREGLLPGGRQGDDGQVAAGRRVLGADLAGEARAHVLDDVAAGTAGARHLGDPLDDRAEVADRDALGEELQHALDAVSRSGRHDLLHEVGVLLRQS
jgi:hypothetical protein